jgi:hypothetical protein
LTESSSILEVFKKAQVESIKLSLHASRIRSSKLVTFCSNPLD